MRFEARLSAVPRARRWVAARAAAAGASAGALRVVELLASELVTNAVRHGPPGGEVVVGVERAGAVVRVHVDDASPDPPVVLDPASHALSGRGVLLVETLARAWGVSSRPGGAPGKRVWFEVALRPGRPDAP